MAVEDRTRPLRREGRYPGWPHPLLVVVSAVLMVVGVWAGLPTRPSTEGLTPDILQDVLTEAAATSKVDPAVVRINATLPLQGAIAEGTGVVLEPGGVVLTNNHVVRGATNITASDVGNGHTYDVDVLGYDRDSDIAVLRLLGAHDLPVAPLADSSGVRVGDAVTGVGFPGGGGLTRAAGVVKSLNRRIVAIDELTGGFERLTDLIEVDADVEAGNSGGPLVDADGRVVGIVTARMRAGPTVTAAGFVIPLRRALAIYDAIRSGDGAGSVHVGPTAIVGFTVADPFSDVITALDGTPVGDGAELTELLDERRPGDTVIVTLFDGNGIRDVPVTLSEGPPD